MDFLPDIDTLSLWLTQYGSISLFLLLTVGIIILPVPEETLMVLAGILMHHGKLSVPYTILAAYLGCICGITVSYILGRTVGIFLLKKYGRWVGITDQKLKKAHAWFDRFGKWALMIGYFIPGIRHFTGLSAGSSNFGVRQFILFAYSGAIIWASIFLSVGYFFGNQWPAISQNLEISLDDILTIVIILALACLAFFLYRKFRKKKK